MRRLTLVVLTLALSLVGMVPATAKAPDEGIRAAQVRLRDLGCDPGRASGRTNAHTRSAVVRLQAANGLRQDGRFRPATSALLTTGTPVRCDDRPVPAGTGQGRRAVVSQGQNYVWLVKADGTVAAQGPMIDNTRVLHPGTFSAGSKCGRPFKRLHNTSGGLWLDHFVRFAPCGIGFHRVPRSMRSGHQIHPDWFLGTNRSVSHGCIRLSAGFAKQVWDFVDVGTEVRVVR